MGLLLLGIGIFAYVDGQDFNQLVDDIASANGSDFTIGLYGGTSLLIIVTSCIIVVVSFLGCCGAWKVFRIFYGRLFSSKPLIFCYYKLWEYKSIFDIFRKIDAFCSSITFLYFCSLLLSWLEQQLLLLKVSA